MPSHLSADLASTRNVNASGVGVVVDTVQTSAGQSVLLLNQSISEYNGLYLVGAGQWQRHPDFATAAQMQAGTTFFVSGGNEHRYSEWYLQESVVTVDANSLHFGRRSYATPVRAGSGLEIDEVSAIMGLPEQQGLQGEYLNPRLEVDARGVVSYATSTGVQEDLMEGLEVTRLSANSVEIGEGRAFVLGANSGEGDLLEVDFPITKSGLTNLPPNSWVYCYLWSNAGSPDIEISTQPPDEPYFGKARAKSGVAPDFVPDETRRYIRRGTLRTDASGNVRPFGVLGSLVRWVADQNTTLRVVNAAANLTTSQVDISPLCPPTAEGVAVAGQIINTDNPSILYVSAAGDGLMTVGGSQDAGQLAVGPSSAQSGRMQGYAPVALAGSRALYHRQTMTGASRSHHVDVVGYYEGD